MLGERFYARENKYVTVQTRYTRHFQKYPDTLFRLARVRNRTSARFEPQNMAPEISRKIMEMLWTHSQVFTIGTGDSRLLGTWGK